MSKLLKREGKMSKLLLVGNDSCIREGLRMRLAFEPGITLVGEVENGTEILSQIQMLRPDVIVIDEVMPDRDSFAAITSLHKASCQCSIILLSLYDDEAIRVQAALAGVAALVGKREGVEALLAAIRQATKP